MTDRQRGSAAELLQPPVVYLLGFAGLILASPLEDLLGDAVARFLACVAFNAVLYRVLRLRLPLAFRPWVVLCGAALGVLLALPSISLAELSMPGALLALVVVVDAAWEELLFRGLAFDFAQRRYGQWGALALSSLCFACAHLLDGAAADPRVFAYLVLGGVLLGAFRLTSGSLWPPLALHAAHNVMLSGTVSDDVSWGSMVVAAVGVGVLLRRLYPPAALVS